MEIKTTIRLLPSNQVQDYITYYPINAASVEQAPSKPVIYLPPQTTGDIGGKRFYKAGDDEPLTSLNTLIG